MCSFLLYYHFRSLRCFELHIHVLPALKDKVRKIQSHQWLSPLGSSRAGTPSWRKVSLPDETFQMTHHPTASKQRRAGLGTEMVLPSSEVTSQAPSQASHQVWATWLSTGPPTTQLRLRAGCSSQGQDLGVHSGPGLLLFHLLCSALHCNCTRSREWTGHSSRNSYQL